MSMACDTASSLRLFNKPVMSPICLLIFRIEMRGFAEKIHIQFDVQKAMTPDIPHQKRLNK